MAHGLMGAEPMGPGPLFPSHGPEGLGAGLGLESLDPPYYMPIMPIVPVVPIVPILPIVVRTSYSAIVVVVVVRHSAALLQVSFKSIAEHQLKMSWRGTG